MPTKANEPVFEKGTPVAPRGGGAEGKLTGGWRRCQMEGCMGRRLGVRWPSGEITWPCTRGMDFVEGAWVIL